MFDKNKKCPLLKKHCIEHDCHWFIQLMGKDPQTGVPLQEFGCAIAWLPLLLIEGAQETRQAAAAIESFRNHMVDDNSRMLTLAKHAAEVKKIGPV